MAEAEVMQVELRHRAEGAPQKDLAIFSEWRQTALPQTLDLLHFYAAYVGIMTDGANGALEAESMVAVFDLAGVPRSTWPELAQQLQHAHAIVMGIQRQAVKESNG